MSDPDTESETPAEPEIERNLGTQPLDAIMIEYALDNNDLVIASKEPITHKAVQRARKGRRLTTHMQRRVSEALFLAATLAGKAPERPWKVKDLFTY
jgi:hypothetical protein